MKDGPPREGLGTFGIQVVPTSLQGKIMETTVLPDFEAEQLELWPEEPLEYVVYGAVQDGSEPKELLRFVVVNGIVASDAFKNTDPQAFSVVSKNVLVGGVILNICRMGVADGYLEVSTTRPPVVLARLEQGSLGLDRQRLKASSTAAQMNEALREKIEGPRKMRTFSGREDPLATAFVTDRTTSEPKEVKAISQGWGDRVRSLLAGLVGRGK